MIHTIYPYLTHDGALVFDAPKHGLVEEPFVNGADQIILLAVQEQGITDPGAGFQLRFSDQPMRPGLDYGLDWIGAETIAGLAGNWYYSPDFEAKGWLCPALLCYYEEAPKQLYFQVAPAVAPAVAVALPWASERRLAGRLDEISLDDLIPHGEITLRDWVEGMSRRLEHRNRLLRLLRPDQPCDHPGCLSHVTHPCEGCGRIAGRWPEEIAQEAGQ